MMLLNFIKNLIDNKDLIYPILFAFIPVLLITKDFKSCLKCFSKILISLIICNNYIIPCITKILSNS